MTERDTRQDDRLRLLIEQLQRAGHTEQQIVRAVREASRDGRPARRAASRRPRRLGIFGRRRRGR